MLSLLSLGALLTALAFPTHALWSWLPETKISLVQSILISFGVALVSAGVLLVFEPRLRTAVRKSAESGVHAAAGSLREEILSDVRDDIDSKISSLEERMSSTISSGIESENQDLEKFKTDFSYHTVRQILELAVSSNALVDNKLVVDATGDPEGLRIGIWLRMPPRATQFDFAPDPTVEDAEIYVVGSIGAERNYVESIWHHSEDSTDAFHGLILQLEAAGQWGRSKTVDWGGVHKRLAHGLDLTVRTRRQDPDSYQLRGRLKEIVGTNQLWFLTDKSIECPEFDWAHEFPVPDRETAFRIAFKGEEPKIPAVPSKPDWADSLIWAHLKRRFG